jgi:hypothetical protein
VIVRKGLNQLEVRGVLRATPRLQIGARIGASIGASIGSGALVIAGLQIDTDFNALIRGNIADSPA